jgi:Glycosyl transferase family 2
MATAIYRSIIDGTGTAARHRSIIDGTGTAACHRSSAFVSRVAIWLTNYAEVGSDNERNLPACLASVLNQTYREFVLYVFDNHSPSPTVHELFQDAIARDSRVVIVPVPDGLAGIPMAHFAWKFLNTKDHTYSITIGGHDQWPEPTFLETLVKRMDTESDARKGDPEIAIVYADTWQVDEVGNVCGRFQNILQVGQIPRAFIPQYVLTGLDSPPFFGLWNERVRKRVPIRHECGGFDHFVVMHATLKGMLLYEGGAKLIMRRPPPGDAPDKYGTRHFSKANLARGQQDFIDQLEWAVHCIDEALEDAPRDQKPTMRMMLISSMMATYLVLRGYNLGQIPGAYQQFTSNPLVIEMMKGCHHATRMAEALIKTSKVSQS